MDSLDANAQEQIKQVLRTAMVGVQPGDQVMLKGYLRVLLRLEADLEWVPANNPNVDLLFINSQFRSVDSVVQLLKMHPNLPVLYVSRGAPDEGSVSGDNIVLPLKKLHDLNEWLLKNVAVLNIKAQRRQTIDNDELDALSNSLSTMQSVTNARIEDKSENLQSTTAQTASKLQNNINKKDQEPIQLKADANQLTNEEGMKLLDFINTLRKSESRFYELCIDGANVGMVNLKRQVIWLNDSTKHQFYKPSVSWALKDTDDEPTEDQSGMDLKQWLWLQAFNEPGALVSLLSPTQEFQLKYWMKPSQDGSQRELLRLFTALESKPRTLNEIAALAETSKEMASKVLAGLLFAGALIPSIYEMLKADIKAYNEGLKEDEISSSEGISISTASTLSIEDILARRESGEVSAPVSSSYDISQHAKTKPKPEKEPESKDEVKAEQPVEPEVSKKRGFLSKLRDKLGL